MLGTGEPGECIRAMEPGLEGEMARSRIDLRNLMARAAIVRKRRFQDDEVVAEELLFDHEELEQIKCARNTGPRPGGTTRWKSDY